MKTILFVPVRDYLTTRKGLWRKFLLPGIVAVLALIGSFIVNLDCAETITAVFSEFIGVQINVVAILIAFSVAIITILVSADNENINQLRKAEADEKNYKLLNAKKLSLFQVLLSNIAYNVIVEILYLLILIGLSLVKVLLPIVILKYISAICIFFIIHILLVLLESVAEMYLTFWSRKASSNS